MAAGLYCWESMRRGTSLSAPITVSRTLFRCRCCRMHAKMCRRAPLSGPRTPPCTMPYYAVPCHVAPCHAVPSQAMLCHAMLCHAMPYCDILCHAVTCRAMPYHATLRYTTRRLLCSAMPCHAMPCHATPSHPIRRHPSFTCIEYRHSHAPSLCPPALTLLLQAVVMLDPVDGVDPYGRVGGTAPSARQPCH